MTGKPLILGYLLVRESICRITDTCQTPTRTKSCARFAFNTPYRQL